MIKTNAMRKYRKALSITLASLLLASSFPVNGGTSLAKSAPSALAAGSDFVYVFGSTGGVNTPGKVLEQWERIKAREQQSGGVRRSVLGGLPAALPALLGAHEIGTRVAAVGFDWARVGDVVGKIREEVDELEAAARHESRLRIEEEMGDLLFSIANLARQLGVEPESALRKANAKFSARFEALEDHLAAQGRSVHEATLEEMEAAWQRVKARG